MRAIKDDTREFGLKCHQECWYSIHCHASTNTGNDTNYFSGSASVAQILLTTAVDRQ